MNDDRRTNEGGPFHLENNSITSIFHPGNDVICYFPGTVELDNHWWSPSSTKICGRRVAAPAVGDVRPGHAFSYSRTGRTEHVEGSAGRHLSKARPLRRQLSPKSLKA